MFYKYRITTSFKFIVILLDADKIFTELDCAFHSTNAANSTVKNIPLDQRKTLDSFNKMFYKSFRQERRLEKNEPSDPQAEVLCFNPIPLSCFKKIIFQTDAALKENSALLEGSNIPCVVDTNYFAPRHDWSFWTPPKRNDDEFDF